MKESQGKVGKNALNEERKWGELLHQGPKPFKFWALTLGTGGSNKLKQFSENNSIQVH